MSYQILLETSTNFGFVALAENNRVLETFYSTEPKSHTEKTHRYVEQALQNQNLNLQDIDFFSCGVGPGSFTGIRVSVNSVKTWSMICEKPVVHINTLESLAMNYFLHHEAEYVFVAINAFKNMVYHALYRRDMDLGPVAVTTEQSTYVKYLTWPEGFNSSCGLVGDGFEVYGKYIPQIMWDRGVRPVQTSSNKEIQKFDFPDPAASIFLAEKKFSRHETKDWKSLTPLYIRASEAEENLRGIKYIPL